LSITPALPDVQEQYPQQAPQLSDEGRTALENLVNGVLKEDLTSRRSEVRKAWQQRNFRNGHQYLWYNEKDGTYCPPEASGQELPRFMDVYNIYTPHWRSFVSILSQNPPGINFVPDDLQRSVDVTSASYAEKMRHRVDRLVHMKDRQAEVAATFCTDGRTITRTWVDKKGQLRITVHGVLESKVPIYARKMERWGYCVLSEEVDLWEAKDQYPDFADDIKGEQDNGEQAYERYARLGILANRKGANGSSDALKNLTTEHHAWVRPSRYRKAPEAVRAELTSLYPDGVHVTMISGKAVECIPQSMEQALKVEWPAPGQGANRPSLLHDLVPIQQAFNDALNMLREHFDFSIPATWVTDTVDSEALSEQRSAPGVIHQITVPNGASINDLVMQEEVAQLPTELVNNIDRLLALAQFITGDLPSLSGEGDPHSETAQGQKMLSDQAKGQLSPAWGGVQWLFAGTYELAIIEAAKLVQDRPMIAVKGSAGQEQFNPAAILDGTWGCYPNQDSSFPETQADQRASLQNVLTQLGQGEQGQAIVFHPANLKLVKQYSGLENLYIPQADARDKQLREIEQMLKEPPVPDQTKIPQWQQAVQQAQLAGQPPPPIPLTSSVPIGKRDYNQFELDYGIEWLSSNQCFEEIQKGNQQGVDNVNLHLDLHEQAIQANAPAPQFEPPKISLTGAITDPNAISQLLAKDGITVSPAEIEASNVLEEQNTAADTQDKAASATHKSVLAAKEQATPIQQPLTPEQQLEAKKSNAKEPK
jgi:hypothetical protein